ncbi:hypothetical protein ACPA3B_24275 [Bacillus bombysepticus]
MENKIDASSISNLNQYNTIVDDAKVLGNLTQFKISYESIEKIGKKEELFSNLEYVKRKMNQLESCGILKKEEYYYKVIEDLIEESTKYIFGAANTVDGTIEHYKTVQNVVDMLNVIEGREKGRE